MKNTIITLASVATLAVTANAQTFPYSTGDYVSFTTAADLFANTNGTLHSGGHPQPSIDRDFGSGFNDYIDRSTGFGVISGINGTATWAAGSIDNFWRTESNGNLNIILNAAAGGYSAADYIVFSSAADLFAGTNGTLTSSANPLDIDRDFGSSQNNFISRINGTGVINGVSGTASWATDRIDDYWYNEDAGTHNLIFRDETVVPEPSSTALLGLGGLALILRRRK